MVKRIVCSLILGSVLVASAAWAEGPVLTIANGPGFGGAQGTFVQRELEKMTGVKLNLIALGGWGDYSTKLNLLMSQKDTMPDIIWRSGMDTEFQQWVDNGQLVDMLPLLKKYGKDILGYYGKDVLWYAVENGKLFKLPGDVAESCDRTLLVRKDWLDALGMKPPRTLDEYKKMLEAFTTKDPDKDGKADTYGSAVYKDSGSWLGDLSFSVFCQAYGVPMGEAWVIQDDGTLKLNTVMPGMKQALKDYSECIAKGWIDKSTASKEMEEVIASGSIGAYYGFIDDLNPSSSRYQAFKKNNPNGSWIAVDLPKGPDGFSSDNPESPNGWCFVSITNHAKDPAMAMKVLDCFASPAGYKLRKFGVEGKNYKIQNGSLIDITPASDRPKLGIDQILWFVDRKDANNLKNTSATTAVFKKRAISSEPLRKKMFWFKTSNRPVYNKTMPDLNMLRDQVFAQIALGQANISVFDKFVSDWYARGGSDVEKEANAVYTQEKADYGAWSKYYAENLKPSD
jgi:ABC-type glycerol-3-phosphate transport system substrate-binding protein